MSTSTEVVQRDAIAQAHLALPPNIQAKVTEEEMRAVIKTQSSGVTITDVIYGYILQEATGLSLAKRELYLARGKNQNGSPGKLLAMAGVNGLIANAERHGDYAGHDGDVHRENDVFEVERQPNGERAITHKYSGSVEDRGKIVGAWAQVYRHGRSSTYFYAPWAEYAPKDPKYGSSWLNNPSAMILKCPLSLCLRRAYDLSGVVGEEEVARLLEDDYTDTTAADTDTSLTAVADEIPEDLRQRFYNAYGEAARLRPGQVTVAAVEMSVKGQDHERIARYIESIEYENDHQGIEPEDRMPQMEEADVVDPTPADDDGSTGSTTEVPSDDVEVLHARRAELYRRMREVTDGPDGERAEVALGEIQAEIDHIEAALLAAGATVPDQEDLP